MRMIVLFDRCGYREKAIQLVNKILAPLNCHVVCEAMYEPDKETLQEEMLDDVNSLCCEFHGAIRAREKPSIVEHFARLVGVEAMQTAKKHAVEYYQEHTD